VFDETNKGPDELVAFRAGVNEPASDVRDRIVDLFADVKRRYSDVFDAGDAIDLDEESIAYVVGELQPYCIVDT
jgi:type I restriction enzyme M protein